MTRPNQARKGGSTKRGKNFLQEKPGTVWHLSPTMTADLASDLHMKCTWHGKEFNISFRFSPAELRALYTRLWYLEKCGKLRRIKP